MLLQHLIGKFLSRFADDCIGSGSFLIYVYIIAVSFVGFFCFVLGFFGCLDFFAHLFLDLLSLLNRYLWIFFCLLAFFLVVLPT